MESLRGELYPARHRYKADLLALGGERLKGQSENIQSLAEAELFDNF